MTKQQALNRVYLVAEQFLDDWKQDSDGCDDGETELETALGIVRGHLIETYGVIECNIGDL